MSRALRRCDVETIPVENMGNAELMASLSDLFRGGEAQPVPPKRPRCSCGGETITFACDCDSSSCGVCDGNGTGHVVVTPMSVVIGMPGRGGVSFDRGAESEARIAAAHEMVDAECRAYLESVLRAESQPETDRAEEDEPIVSAPALYLDALAAEPMPPAAPMDLMAVLAAMVRVAVQDAPIDFRDKARAMAQLGGAR